MRVRLMCDVIVDDDKITQLGEYIAEQPTVKMEIKSSRGLGKLNFTGRFMGAKPVEGTEELERMEGNTIPQVGEAS